MLAIVVFVPCEGPFLKRFLWSPLRNPQMCGLPPIQWAIYRIPQTTCPLNCFSLLATASRDNGQKCKMYKLFGKITVG
jgi:hypothetical protein